MNKEISYYIFNTPSYDKRDFYSPPIINCLFYEGSMPFLSWMDCVAIHTNLRYLRLENFVSQRAISDHPNLTLASSSITWSERPFSRATRVVSIVIVPNIMQKMLPLNIEHNIIVYKINIETSQPWLMTS
jgi:hypothetical protein